MPKLNTKSRLELAHLKRQLDISKKLDKQGKIIQEDGETSAHQEENKKAPDNSRFDYKFVFTNSAMRNDDRSFKVRNHSVAMEVIKKLVPTQSFLPYGVTIRNPHMFEEDQLAVIQRRQEVQNITYPSVPYNPLRTMLKENQRVRVQLPGERGKSNGFNDSSRISARYGRTVNGGVTTGNGNDLNPETSSRAHAHKSVATEFSVTPTKARDSDFRQKYTALQAKKASAATKRYQDYSSGRKVVKKTGIDRGQDAIDKLSSTVQDLNRYEERLKHYLKSKNTMAYAGAALKQLRFKRSQTVVQLSKMSSKLELEKERTGRTAAFKNYSPNTFLPSASAPKTSAVQERNSKSFPKSGRIDLEANLHQSLKNAYTLPGGKLSDFIGKRILSTGATPHLEALLSPSNSALGSETLAPSETPKTGGVEEDKSLAESSLNNPHEEHRSKSHTRSHGISGAKLPNTASTKLDDKGSRKKQSTIRTKRYQQRHTTPTHVQIERLPDSSNLAALKDPQLQLFVDKPRSHHAISIPGIESRRGSDIVRRAYQDFQIHEDKVQVELMRERERKLKDLSDISSRRMGFLNQFLHKNATYPRPAPKSNLSPISPPHLQARVRTSNLIS